ncbi:MAG: hypothetical protein ACD_62C00378G0002 [uncultured bacterium]|nr:MAG: hypothetical protein ACD_62C00378G0002 [uncultured bacterium]HLD45277.1 1-deoxy-D-xylulose-5-phosphate synthase [bacterium]
MNQHLSKIQTPAEVKKLSLKELELLAETLRSDIVQHTSTNGGHVAPSLGCVDIIVALHRVFETPEDTFVFDVGHQAYAHKMLTGRRFEFYKLRRENGLSGFTTPSESVHDGFGSGHASTSISVALGILEGKRKLGDQHHVIAILGDGSLTGGLAFEALNHAGELKRNLIVVLNDNQMSIDRNVGGLKDSLGTPDARDYFGALGFDYWGPGNGHDIPRMVRLFEKARKHRRPLVLHVRTQKGKGYQPAIADQTNFHGCGPFDITTGSALKSPTSKVKYQDLFAQTLIEMASIDDKIVAITAAMPSGTSLNRFKNIHPDKFYDVGIAEAHAVTFACGLATQGIKPFVCIYSTFMQRAYDQLVHDAGINNLPIKICMDRGGLVGDDGVTHQGVFDFAFLRTIPNFVIMAPKDEVELQRMMETARLYQRGPISLRFPRGEVVGVPLPSQIVPLPIGKAEHLYGDAVGDVLLCAIGSTVRDAVTAAKILEEQHSLSVGVINLRFAKPLDEGMITSLARNFRVLLTVEDGVVKGGVGSAILECLTENHMRVPVKCLGVPDAFVRHASQARQREFCHLDAQSIVREARELLVEATSCPLKQVANKQHNVYHFKEKTPSLVAITPFAVAKTQDSN